MLFAIKFKLVKEIRARYTTFEPKQLNFSQGVISDIVEDLSPHQVTSAVTNETNVQTAAK